MVIGSGGHPRARTSVSSHRPHQVELFLDRQRPEVQQRLSDRRDVEIAGLAPQDEVRRKRRPTEHVPAHHAEIVGGQRQSAKEPGRRQHDDERGENTPTAARIKILQREPSFTRFAPDNRRNQVTGNDEENIDTDKSADEHVAYGVEQDHEQDGNAAKTVDIRSVVMRRAFRQRVGKFQVRENYTRFLAGTGRRECAPTFALSLR